MKPGRYEQIIWSQTDWSWTFSSATYHWQLLTYLFLGLSICKMVIIVLIHRVIVRMNEIRYVEHWRPYSVQVRGTKGGVEEAGILVIVSG